MKGLARDQWIALVLVAPAFLYLAVRLISGYQGWDAASGFGFILIPLLLAIGLYPIWGALIELSGFLLLGVIATLATLTGALGTTGFDLAAGVLLASPFLLGLWAWGPNRSAPARLIGLGVALLEGIILLATLASISANPPYQENATGLFSWYTQVNIEQLCGLAGLLASAPGSCAVTSQFPLRDLVDPLFVFLAGVAFLGALLPVLVPRTARGVEGDAEGWDEFEATSRPPPDLMLTEEMVRGLSLRTPPASSPDLLPPGALALLGATVLALLFVLVAIDDAPLVLLPMIVVVIGALGAILASDRPVSAQRRRLPSAPRQAVGVPAAAPSMRANPPVGGGFGPAAPPPAVVLP
jgi:hypothetical protein